MSDPVSALEEGVPPPTSADADTKTPSAKGHMDQPPSLARLSSARRGPEGGQAGFGQRHGSSAYNVDREVLLNLEFVSDRMVKINKLLALVQRLLSAALLVYLAYRKIRLGVAGLVNDDVLGWINMVIANLYLASTLSTLVFFCWRISRANASRRHWNRVRRIMVHLQLAKLVLLAVVLVCYVVQASLWFAQPCRPFAMGLRICQLISLSAILFIYLVFIIEAHAAVPLTPGPAAWWQAPLHRLFTGGRALIVPEHARYVLDLPFSVHAGKVLFLWLPGQVFLALTFADSVGAFGDDSLAHCPDDAVCAAPAPGQACDAWLQGTLGDRCVPEATRSLVFISLGFAWLMLMLAFAGLYLTLAYTGLARFRYQEHRAANIAVRSLGHRVVDIAIIFVACMVCFWYVGINSCASYVATVYGMAPFVIILSEHVLGLAVTYAPMPPKAREVALHIWLQSLAWTEADKPRLLAERPALYAKEPMFCFETALKAFYFSELVYYYDGTDKLKIPEELANSTSSPKLSVAVALAFGMLTDHEAIVEPEQDLTCMLGWGEASRTIVLAFRGTASLANVWLDLQVWRRPHPPGMKGHAWNGSLPMAHAGFLACWTKHGFGERVRRRVREIVTADGQAGRGPPWTIHCFGHSLGGALACLCAADLQLMARELAADLDRDASASEAQRAQLANPTPGGADEHARRSLQPGAGDGQAHGRENRAAHSSPRSPSSAPRLDPRASAAGTGTAEERARRAAPVRADSGVSAASSSAPRPLIYTVSSYTYGCPRLGNHALARLYKEWVPDGWDLVHTNDVIARNGKFLRLYKRAAHRVVVSPGGDLIVRPSLAETTVIRGHSSVEAHLLSTYARSLSAILKAQAGSMGDDASRAAIMDLVSKAFVAQVMGTAGVPPSQHASMRKRLYQLQEDQNIVTGDFFDAQDDEQGSSAARAALGLERVSGLLQEPMRILGESGNMLREFFGDWIVSRSA